MAEKVMITKIPKYHNYFFYLSEVSLCTFFFRTVVSVNVSKSQGLYTSVMKRSKEHNSALGIIGRVDVDIPQHPVVLHGMVARSSKRLSSTLQEFIRPPLRAK